MADPLKHMNAGDAFRPSAQRENMISDAVRDFRARPARDIGKGGSSFGKTFVYNVSGQSIGMHGIVGIGDAKIEPSATDDSFLFHRVFETADPDADEPFGVIQLPCDIEGVAEVVFSGVTWAYVNITDEAHEYAAPIAGDYVKLASQAAVGPARILDKESGTGIKWCFVLLDMNATFSGLSSLEGATGPAIDLSLGTSGSDLSWEKVSNSQVRLNVPDASATARGVVTTGAQEFEGQKKFLQTVIVDQPYSGTNRSSIELYDLISGVTTEPISRYTTGGSGTLPTRIISYDTHQVGGPFRANVYLGFRSSFSQYGSIFVLDGQKGATGSIYGTGGSDMDLPPAYGISTVASGIEYGATATVLGLSVKGGIVLSSTAAVATSDITNNNVTFSKLEDFGAYTLLLRNAGTSGDPDDVKISALTEEAAPTTGDMILIEESGGALRRVDWSHVASSIPTQVTVQDTDDTTCFVALFEDNVGDLGPKADGGLTYNATTGTLTATAFSGPLTGNVTGNVSGNAATVTTNANLTGEVTSTGNAAVLDKTAITNRSADATPDPAADYVLTYDASATALKKVLIQNLPAGGVPTQVTVADTTDATCFVALFESATGDLAPKTDGGLTYNAATAVLTATGFAGALTGNASTSTVAATVTVADTTDATCSVALFESATGNLGAMTDGGLTYNASTGTLTATAFAGPLTGNADTVTVADAGGDTTTWVLLGTAQTGSLAPATDAGLTYNATTNALTATTFVGALTGNADTVTTNANLTGEVTSTGNAAVIDKTAITNRSADATPDPAADYVLTYDASATALKKVLIQNLPAGGVPTQVTVADTTDATCFVALFESATGDLAPKTDAGLAYDASAGDLTVGGTVSADFLEILDQNGAGAEYLTLAVAANLTANRVLTINPSDANRTLTLTADATVSGTNTGDVAQAAQSDQETATSTATTVSPGRQQYHPSAVKAWWNFNGTDMSNRANYNIASYTDSGVGLYRANYTTAMSSTSYGFNLTTEYDSGTDFYQIGVDGDTAPQTTYVPIAVRGIIANALADPRYVTGSAYGDQ